MSCKFARRTWRRMEKVRRILELQPRTSLRELLTGIPPGTRTPGGSYKPAGQERHFAWDVPRLATLWQLRCTRNRLIFQEEPINVTEVCHLAWRDTIHTGMLKYYPTCSEKRKTEIDSEFKCIL